jgi:hypothetical protein
MREKLPDRLEEHRIREGEYGSQPGMLYGAFAIQGPCGMGLAIISSGTSEEWRPVKGYEGLYEVSNTGIVRALPKRVPLPNGGFREHELKTLSPEAMEKGYLRVTLCRGHREMDKKLIHVLVADAFIPNGGADYSQVNHRNGVKRDNWLSNLERCTPSYNLWHAIETGLIVDKEYHGPQPEPPIRCEQYFDPWEHVSVSGNRRVPNWQEMCFVKDLFWAEEECVMQLHPPKSEYVNCHPFCLHLWRSLEQPIPTPNSILVGLKTDEGNWS